jgi:hypothetical protein
VGASEWTGKISTVSGNDLSDYRDVVINLPRSWRDHLNNQPAFGPDGCVYWSQGSHTAMGAPTDKWNMARTERLLSAAVLRLDPRKVTGDKPLDAKTVDGGGAYDPFAKDAPLTIFATGVRLGYEMLWHSNGRLYTAVNGSAEGGRTPGNAGVNTAAIRRIDSAQHGPYDGGDILPMTVSQNAARPAAPPRAGRLLRSPQSRPRRVRPVRRQPDRRQGSVRGHQLSRRHQTGSQLAQAGVQLRHQRLAQRNDRVQERRQTVRRARWTASCSSPASAAGRDIIVLSLDDNGSVIESVSGIAGLNAFTQPLDLPKTPRPAASTSPSTAANGSR